MYIKRTMILVCTLTLMGAGRLAGADALVLIHGYMGSPFSWESSHINSQLEHNGWPRGGLIFAETGELIPPPGKHAHDKHPENVSYLIDLPWMRPLKEQTYVLNTAMQRILQLRPEEEITLVGHSAGALVARLWLVKYYDPAVIRLISIAAPNLGTSRADDALNLTQPLFPPFDFARNAVGGKRYNTLRRSRKLVRDFTPPGRDNRNILYWLNQQPHPEIEYVSLVREDRAGNDQDWLVPASSQDLNNVPALRGKATSYIVDRPHELHWKDGRLLVSLLNGAVQ